MIYLLDTNTCINYLNGRSERVKQQIEMKHPDDIVLCAVVKAELFYGAMKSSRPESNLIKQKKFAAQFVSLSFDDRAAEEYGRIRAQLEKRGTPIGPNDLLIAAIAVANGVTLVTHNLREFEKVEGLRLEDWEI